MIHQNVHTRAGENRVASILLSFTFPINACFPGGILQFPDASKDAQETPSFVVEMQRHLDANSRNVCKITGKSNKVLRFTNSRI